MANQIRINYISDVEGNCHYFDTYVSMCPDLEYKDQDKKVLQLKDNAYFVYGGDAPDRGFDLTFTSKLLALKERYPDRVFLIIGNRDLNKLKLLSELSDKDINRPVDSIPGAFWLPKDQITLKMFLEELIEKNTEIKKTKDGNYPQEAYSKFHTKTNKLKWLLLHTMGCPNTFEFRRQELASLAKVDASTITDDQVTQDYLNCAYNEQGIYRKYLSLGQIGLCLGNTLFLHGSINEKSIFFIPTDEYQDNVQTEQQVLSRGRVLEGTSVQKWIEELNSWAKGHIDAALNNYEWNDERTDRPGRPLMGYAYRVASHDYSCLINDWTVDGNPSPATPKIASLLLKSGICRVITGHKPFGDSPCVMKKHGVEVVVADTSYSDMSAPDTRGAAVAAITLVGNLTHNALTVSGRLKDNQEIAFTLPTLDPSGTESDPTGQADPLIGQQTPDGFWVKGKIANSDTYSLAFGKGRSVEYKFFTKNEVLAELTKQLEQQASL